MTIMGFSLKYSLALFGAVLLSGCVKTVVQDGGNDLSPMQFGKSEVMTRSIVTNDSFENEGTVFNVWGTYHSSSDRNFIPVDVFSGTEVTKTGSKWSYDDTRYWLPGFRYNFRALHPAVLAASPGMVSYSYAQDEDHPHGNPDNAVLSISSYDGRSGHDILYAASGPIAAVLGKMPAVAFDFNHILAYVLFEGAVDPSVDREVEIVSAKFYGVSATGSCTSAPSPAGTWDVTGGEKSTGQNPYAETSQVLSLTSKYVSVFPRGSEILMIPQDIQTGTMFEIQYRYTSGNTALRTVRTDISSIGASFKGWKAGSTYRYRFCIGDTDFIVFDKPTVTEWIDQDGGNYIIQ